MNEPFKLISPQFTIGKQEYKGAAVFSRDRLYLVMRELYSKAAQCGYGFGGLAGGLLTELATSNKNSNVSVGNFTLGQLDAATLHHPQWPVPIKRKNGNNPLAIVDKSTVELVEHPRFTDLLKFKVNGVPISLQYNMFTGRKTRDYLIENEWPLKWCGTTVYPK